MYIKIIYKEKSKMPFKRVILYFLGKNTNGIKTAAIASIQKISIVSKWHFRLFLPQ
jgi:hypothetical protein